jgi:hypothetical protein
LRVGRAAPAGLRESNIAARARHWIMASLRPAIALLALQACYAPDRVDCTLRCGSDGDCPDGASCHDGLCASVDAPADRCCGALLPDQRFVDVAGRSGSATGSAACPHRTITAALDAVVAAGLHGVTVHVAAGTYDARRGERFPLALRNGTSLVGAGQGTTVIDGSGDDPLFAEGGWLAAWARPYRLAIKAGDDQATTHIAHLTLRITRAAGETIPPATYALVCDRGTSPPIGKLAPPPNTLVEDVALGPGFEVGLVVSNSSTSGCNVRVTGSRFGGLLLGVFAHGGLPEMPPVALALGDGSDAGANRFASLHDPDLCGSQQPQAFTLGCSSKACALWAQYNVNQLLMQRNLVSDSDCGVLLYGGLSRGVYRVEDNQILGAGTFGMFIGNEVHVDELSGNEIRDSAGPAIQLVDSASARHARNNVLAGNLVGLYVLDNAIGTADRPSLDFGTASDPGNNVFSCNSGDPAAHGADVALNLNAPSAVPLQMSGNSWDHVPPTRGVAGAPDGTDIVDLSGVGATVNTDGATRARDCAAGHLR